MSTVFIKICFFFLTLIVFQESLCLECQNLETGDLTGFDIQKYTGRYELVMGVLGDSPLGFITLNCNGVTIKQHPHPDGGINMALVFEDTKQTVLDSFIGHMNSSTDIYITEVGGYHSGLEKWTDASTKIILATDDLLVLATCINNEDDKDDTDFTVLILRKGGSTLSVSKVQEKLPESIKNNSELEPLCDH